jgi:divalent metal cation (Fe/Co/Zn/Cd) transporter
MIAESSVDDAKTVKTVLLLSWASLFWMTAEGAVGLIAGIQSGSIALIGWALGSAVEGLASVIVIWRFTGNRKASKHSEEIARKAVAVSFWLLAPYIAVEAIRDLVTRDRAEATLLGLAVTFASLVIMPGLGIAKRRLGDRLHSEATEGEGTQNLLCAAQAAIVLVGLAANWALGIWWLDPVVALVLAAWIAHEGLESWRGKDCC